MKKERGIYLRGGVYWITYSHHGIRHRESCESDKITDARALLKQRQSEGLNGKLLTAKARRTTIIDLCDLVLANYKASGRKSNRRQVAAFGHLHDFFGQRCEADRHVCFVEGIERDLPKYREWREAQASKQHTVNPKLGCADATVNRELAALRRGFRLAARQHLVASVPYFEIVCENNQRKGFFERAEFEAVRNHCPDYFKPVVDTAYYTGWRKEEILTRKNRHVVDGNLILERGETKNGEGRIFPLDSIPEFKEVIEKQLAANRELGHKLGRIVEWLFPDPRGNQIGGKDGEIRDVWKKALAAAGLPGKLFHDFRRTAVRDMERSGVPRSTAMKVSGHKTESIYRRYAIVDEAMIREGMQKRAAFIETQKAQPQKVVTLVRAAND